MAGDVGQRELWLRDRQLKVTSPISPTHAAYLFPQTPVSTSIKQQKDFS